MPRLRPSVAVLGSGTAVPTTQRDNTALVLQKGVADVLIDCPGSPAARLERAGVDLMRLAAIVITHAHADHLYGLPSLIHNLQLLGRSIPLSLFVQPEDVDRIHNLLAVFRLEASTTFLRVRSIPAEGTKAFWEHAGHKLRALRVDHSLPTCAIRWDLASPSPHWRRGSCSPWR